MMNPRFPHVIVISRESKTDPFSPQTAVQVIYTGGGRSYQMNVTDKGVLVSRRVIALPGRQDTIEAGDLVETLNGNIHESGKVQDVVVTNFGTNIIWEYVRNE